MGTTCNWACLAEGLRWRNEVTCYKFTVERVSLACLFSGRTISPTTSIRILQLQPQQYSCVQGGISPTLGYLPQ